FGGKTCWVHARAGAIPAGEPGNSGRLPLVILTTQKLELTGMDVFHPLHVLQTSDMGAHWTKPKKQTVLSREEYSASNLARGAKGFEKLLKPGDETVVSDFTPQWHVASKKLLGIGHTVWYRKNRAFNPRPRH